MQKNACDVYIVNVLYLNKNDIKYANIVDSVYKHGKLKFHHVKRTNEESIKFFFNSQYKKNLEMSRKICYG